MHSFFFFFLKKKNFLFPIFIKDNFVFLEQIRRGVMLYISTISNHPFQYLCAAADLGSCFCIINLQLFSNLLLQSLLFLIFFMLYIHSLLPSCKTFRSCLICRLGLSIRLVLASHLFGNILFLGVVYSYETTNLIHIGLAKSFKNGWLS